MNLYSLKNLFTNSVCKRNKSLIVAGILLTGFLLGCGTGGPDTFVQFQAGEETYKVKEPTFVVTRMPFDIHLLELTDLSMRLAPRVLIQWRMKLKSLEQLAGKNLDLKIVDPNHIEPVTIFRITKDLSVQGQQHSEIVFEIERIEDGIIEGSFSGTDLIYVSNTQKANQTTDVTARFRAKLVEKHWEDNVRSRKRATE